MDASPEVTVNFCFGRLFRDQCFHKGLKVARLEHIQRGVTTPSPQASLLFGASHSTQTLWRDRLSIKCCNEPIRSLQSLLAAATPQDILFDESSAWYNSAPQNSKTYAIIDSHLLASENVNPGYVLSVRKPTEDMVFDYFNLIQRQPTKDEVELFILLNGFCEGLPNGNLGWVDLFTQQLPLDSESINKNYGDFMLSDEWSPFLEVFLSSSNIPIVVNKAGQYGWWRWMDGEPIVPLAASAGELAAYFVPYLASIDGIVNLEDRPLISPYE